MKTNRPSPASRQIALKCQECGAAFLGPRQRKYCGHACKTRAYRRRLAEREAEELAAGPCPGRLERDERIEALPHSLVEEKIRAGYLKTEIDSVKDARKWDLYERDRELKRLRRKLEAAEERLARRGPFAPGGDQGDDWTFLYLGLAAVAGGLGGYWLGKTSEERKAAWAKLLETVSGLPVESQGYAQAALQALRQFDPSEDGKQSP